MSNYAIKAPRRRWPLLLAIIVVLIALLGGGAMIFVRRTYDQNLKPVNANQKRITITIPLGSSLHEIASILKSQELIRSDWAFERYVRNAGQEDELQAGTYSLQPSLSVQEIVTILTKGHIAKDLVTIFPGNRLDEITSDLINNGFNEAAVTAALDPTQYPNHPALTDKPTKANFEGYLYPESFQKTAETTPNQIIEQSLDELNKVLTPDIRNAIIKQGLTLHEGIILASVIEKEVPDTNAEDRPKVAQVFLKRLAAGIKLESDATAPYGAVLAGSEDYGSFDSPYNTYLYPGLPPTPISNVSKSSLLAVASPAATDYLFFVTGNDCVTRFSADNAEHDRYKLEHGIGCKSD